MAGRRVAPLAVIALVGAAAVAGADGHAVRSNGPHRGGTYRVAFEQSFNFTDGLDPTGEYFQYSFGILSNLLVRTLVGYNHAPGAAGNRIVPDLATSVPAPTDGGRTYTFHLKAGIKFGPPLDRPITSKDVLYAFERLATPKDGAQYAFYYTPIAGFGAFGAGKAKTISGIQTPDDRTIVFHLTQPTGDFLYRLGMTAAGPIPQEVAGCFEGEAGRYGKDLVSTGPYMLEGADKVDASSCAKLKSMSGWDGVSRLVLVRNPDYDPTTDSPAARQNFPDRFEFTLDPNGTDIIDRVAAGQLDDEALPALPPQAIERYEKDPAKRSRLRANPGDSTQYISLNLTQPPFDDVHVRRAMNWIIDKAGLRQFAGGPIAGKIATHIVPDTIFDNELADYDPYRTPGEHGSLAKAKAAMRGSRYDLHHDGTCSAAACHDVLLLDDSGALFQRMLPTVVADAKKLGITFHVSIVAGAFPTLENTSKNIAIAIFPGWLKDYADALTFFSPLFDGRTIIQDGNVNYSLVGLRPSQAKSLGVTGTVTGIPSVDGRLDRCAALAGIARRSCYESLDRYLMTEVVPWVPWLSNNWLHIIGPRVTRYEWDQFSGTPAYAHVAVQ